MKQLFLTSMVKLVAQSVTQRIKTKTGHLRTVYVTTPTEKGCGDDLTWSDDNKKSMQAAGFDIFEYTITDKTSDDLERDLAEVDVIYVEGGSLIHMLDQIQSSGFDAFVKKFVSEGHPYIGTSTGSFIAAPETEAGLPLEEYVRDNFNSKGLGLVNFILMPHWGTEEFQNSYNKVPLEQYNTKVPMITLTDSQYVWVVGNKLEIVNVAS